MREEDWSKMNPNPEDVTDCPGRQDTRVPSDGR